VIAHPYLLSGLAFVAAAGALRAAEPALDELKGKALGERRSQQLWEELRAGKLKH